MIFLRKKFRKMEKGKKKNRNRRKESGSFEKTNCLLLDDRILYILIMFK